MLAAASKLLSYLPLSLVHRLGAMIGIIFNFCSPITAKTRSDNLRNSGLYPDAAGYQTLLSSNIQETGKAILETFYIWSKSNQAIAELVCEVPQFAIIEAALRKGKGIIFLTPHMGCFEITSLFYALHHPITVLYRPPKKKWLMPFINIGRARANITLAPANIGGVRILMKALGKNQAIGILPDQIPAAGEGEWANFFGKPAYTMTLASKLAEKTGATIIMAFGERLSQGRGYTIHLREIDSIATPTLLNQAIEQQIAQNPAQYLWQYNRYKVRRKARAKQQGLAG